MKLLYPVMISFIIASALCITTATSHNSSKINDDVLNSFNIKKSQRRKLNALPSLHELGGLIYRGTNVENDITGLAISDDGTIVAIGQCRANPNGSGSVGVYQYTNAWSQLGSDLTGTGGDDDFGFGLDLSADGRILAIGIGRERTGTRNYVEVYRYNKNADTWDPLSDIARNPDATARTQGRAQVSLSPDGLTIAVGDENTYGGHKGRVTVYYYRSSTNSWVIKGSMLGNTDFDRRRGNSVKLSGGGNIVALQDAAGWDMGTGDDPGLVTVYRYDSTREDWVEYGSSILGLADGDKAGFGLDMSTDGSILAIGGSWNDGVDGTKDRSGQVSVFRYLSNDWHKMGQDLYGDGDGDRFGRGLAISSNGLILAISAFRNNDGGALSGHIKVFYYNISYNRWEKAFENVNGPVVNGKFGKLLTLSGDGSTVVGASVDGFAGIYTSLLMPSSRPSKMPSYIPSEHPSNAPSMVPSFPPSIMPSFLPTISPSYKPSNFPTDNPSTVPSIKVTFNPSRTPTRLPSFQPSLLPSTKPTQMPTTIPSFQPSILPSLNPSKTPSRFPSSKPSLLSSNRLPSTQPSLKLLENTTNSTSSKFPTLYQSRSPSSYQPSTLKIQKFEDTIALGLHGVECTDIQNTNFVKIGSALTETLNTYTYVYSVSVNVTKVFSSCSMELDVDPSLGLHDVSLFSVLEAKGPPSTDPMSIVGNVVEENNSDIVKVIKDVDIVAFGRLASIASQSLPPALQPTPSPTIVVENDFQSAHPSSVAHGGNHTSTTKSPIPSDRPSTAPLVSHISNNPSSIPSVLNIAASMSNIPSNEGHDNFSSNKPMSVPTYSSTNDSLKPTASIHQNTHGPLSSNQYAVYATIALSFEVKSSNCGGLDAGFKSSVASVLLGVLKDNDSSDERISVSEVVVKEEILIGSNCDSRRSIKYDVIHRRDQEEKDVGELVIIFFVKAKTAVGTYDLTSYVENMLIDHNDELTAKLVESVEYFRESSEIVPASIKRVIQVPSSAPSGISNEPSVSSKPSFISEMKPILAAVGGAAAAASSAAAASAAGSSAAAASSGGSSAAAASAGSGGPAVPVVHNRESGNPMFAVRKGGRKVTTGGGTAGNKADTVDRTTNMKGKKSSWWDDFINRVDSLGRDEAKKNDKRTMLVDMSDGAGLEESEEGFLESYRKMKRSMKRQSRGRDSDKYSNIV